ncbi:MAG: hypothetical protein DWQ08_14230 [Proteobacteria bacterium]|nr:MAG: hypothetical protein DWQ08_14230 [Pseudomonadota bacterium]
MRKPVSLSIVAISSLVFSLGLINETDAGLKNPHRLAAILAKRVNKLESALLELQSRIACVSTTSDHRNIYFEGCNVHVRNGLGGTNSVNAYGNLIVGYDEISTPGPGTIPAACSDGKYQDIESCNEAGATWARSQKTGSHNLVVGAGHSYTQAAGVVFGGGNVTNRFAATATGGFFNVAAGIGAAVSGGLNNQATGGYSSVGGGDTNRANGDLSNIGGGSGGMANGAQSSISGGWNNVTNAQYSSISGGRAGTTGALGSSISGGNMNRTNEGEDFSGTFASISGGLENQTNGAYASVSGGYRNAADGVNSTIGGGRNRSVSGGFDWRAGGLFEDQ